MNQTKEVVQCREPFSVDVKMGNTYLWCSCGKSKRPPFCDGMHGVSEFKPIRYIARDFGTLLFCGCKQTGTPPFCDGSHKALD